MGLCSRRHPAGREPPHLWGSRESVVAAGESPSCLKEPTENLATVRYFVEQFFYSIPIGSAKTWRRPALPRPPCAQQARRARQARLARQNIMLGAEPSGRQSWPGSQEGLGNQSAELARQSIARQAPLARESIRQQA